MQQAINMASDESDEEVSLNGADGSVLSDGEEPVPVRICSQCTLQALHCCASATRSLDANSYCV